MVTTLRMGGFSSSTALAVPLPRWGRQTGRCAIICHMKVTFLHPREIRPPRAVALRVSATPLLLSKTYRIIKSCAELHAQDDAGEVREGALLPSRGLICKTPPPPWAVPLPLAGEASKSPTIIRKSINNEKMKREVRLPSPAEKANGMMRYHMPHDI